VICEGESYSFNGLSIVSSGTYADTVAGTGGSCDTIVSLELTVHPIANENIIATFCPGGSYDFNGTTLTAAGVYTDTLTTVNGCDSIITLTLTEDAYQTSSISAVICEGDSYTFNGETLISGGTYVD